MMNIIELESLKFCVKNKFLKRIALYYPFSFAQIALTVRHYLYMGGGWFGGERVDDEFFNSLDGGDKEILQQVWKVLPNEKPYRSLYPL